MKIALIGNMNNNFFSIMRYLRDLGLDAHLFMYENQYDHFKPEKDTYHIEEYQPYIHILPIVESVKGLFFLDKKRIKLLLKEYDFFIGSGFAPALFYRLDTPLDIFIPHDDGLEHTSNMPLTFVTILKNLVRRYVTHLQVKGLQKNTTKVIASGVQDITNNALERVGLTQKYIKKYLLMVYLEEENNPELKTIIEKIKKHDFIIFSHTRHVWQEDALEVQIKEDGGKGLNKLIIAYSQFIKKNHNSKPLLVFFEYGQDVEASKELIKELQIEEYVLWLNLMPRKDILQLIGYADIVVDSLCATMWGGVGWEGLTRGKILMQNIVQSDEEYKEEMGHNLPFILKAFTIEEVEKHLNDFVLNRKFYLDKASQNREWFDKYAGVGLAKEYKEIIEELYKEKIK